METAKIEGPKALMRVSYELVKHPIIGRMVATQIRLIDEERQAAQRAEQVFRTTALSDIAWPDNPETQGCRQHGTADRILLLCHRRIYGPSPRAGTSSPLCRRLPPVHALRRRGGEQLGRRRAAGVGRQERRSPSRSLKAGAGKRIAVADQGDCLAG